MRRRLAVIGGAALAGLLLTACAGKDNTSVDTGATGTTATTAAAGSATFDTTLVNGKPHFETPEEAMRYLAASWTADDLTSLKHVTDPSARAALDTMHGVAINLRLNHCEKQPEGDYMCHFDHDYPPHASTTLMEHHGGNRGEAIFRVGPATTPGWYMTVFESCS